MRNSDTVMRNLTSVWTFKIYLWLLKSAYCLWLCVYNTCKLCRKQVWALKRVHLTWLITDEPWMLSFGFALMWFLHKLCIIPEYFSHPYWQPELWSTSSLYIYAQDTLKKERHMNRFLNLRIVVLANACKNFIWNLLTLLPFFFFYLSK